MSPLKKIERTRKEKKKERRRKKKSKIGHFTTGQFTVGNCHQVIVSIGFVKDVIRATHSVCVCVCVLCV